MEQSNEQNYLKKIQGKFREHRKSVEYEKRDKESDKVKRRSDGKVIEYSTVTGRSDTGRSGLDGALDTWSKFLANIEANKKEVPLGVYKKTTLKASDLVGKPPSAEEKERNELRTKKLRDIMNKEYLKLPVLKDFPRLASRITITYSDGTPIYTPVDDPSGPSLHVVNVLTCIVGRLQGPEMAAAIKSRAQEEQKLEIGVCLQNYLSLLGGEGSKTVSLIKAFNQDAVAPAVIELKTVLGLPNLTKDVANTWVYEIVLPADESDREYRHKLRQHQKQLRKSKEPGAPELNKPVSPSSNSSVLTTSTNATHSTTSTCTLPSLPSSSIQPEPCNDSPIGTPTESLKEELEENQLIVKVMKREECIRGCFQYKWQLRLIFQENVVELVGSKLQVLDLAFNKRTPEGKKEEVIHLLQKYFVPNLEPRIDEMDIGFSPPSMIKRRSLSELRQFSGSSLSSKNSSSSLSEASESGSVTHRGSRVSATPTLFRRGIRSANFSAFVTPLRRNPKRI
eukprot:TRINITY_DN6436_c0_g1_i1.p1 TRINITY_DN6436_c0_g1~~TRINITY_DN6436_c0_g1_i1.p1  ORF type:complete len:522 (-),score=89.58 TRINITY_DN6436_c0_g1_i1:206-1729(-)